ncbi:MAG TPA: glycerophosphodiester phosphodiesterase, partial [Microbacterium sp.]|nr:glycerophosphodiester phosphodiesterase [Microbacterium sp.]
RVVIESFELTILRRLRERGTHAELVFLLEAGGIPADQLTDPTSRSYTEWMTPEGLDVLAAHVDGISPDKTVILAPDAEGRATGPAPVVARAHERGLAVFTWTCRPENAFLLPPFRTGDLADYGDWRSEWAVLARAGLDGVFVDHADLGVEVFGTEPIGEGG